MAALPLNHPDHPAMRAWEDYKATDAYATAHDHAFPGALWNAFLAGYRSATIASLPVLKAAEADLAEWYAMDMARGQPRGDLIALRAVIAATEAM